MRLHLHLLVFALCLGITHYANGVQLQISRTKLSDLIEQPGITSILRDGTGYLWIGTHDALYRFDGNNLTAFSSDKKSENWIPYSNISAIAEDGSGNLFLSTYLGDLLKWDKLSNSFILVHTVESTKQSNILRMHIDKADDVWLGTNDKLIHYNPELDATSTWLDDQKIDSKLGKPYSFTEDASGHIYVGGNLGLVKISPRKKLVEKIDLGRLDFSSTFSITALEFDNNDNLFLGTDTGQVLLVDLESEKVRAKSLVIQDALGLISNIVHYESNLLIGTDRGLYVSDTKLSFVRDISRVGSGLSSTDIYTLYQDEKYTWIGTIDGLDLLSSAPFELFNFENSGVFNDIMAFEEDSKGNIWIATYSGLYIYDETAGIHRIFSEKQGSPILDDQRVTAISARGDHLWIGFYRGGVHKINVLTGDSVALNLDTSSELAITKIVANQVNDDVWVATYNRGLFRISENEVFEYYKNKSLPEKTITSIFLSTMNDVLAVSDNNIYRYNPQTDSFLTIDFDFKLGGKRPVIFSLYKTNNDDILIGTKDYGLFIWPRETQLANQYTLSAAGAGSNLAALTIYAIEQDSLGNIWCSTDGGIVKLDYRGQQIGKFSTTDGLQGKDFQLGASFTSKKGLIYFGGANGYNRFNPNEIEIDKTPPKMLLTGINLPGKNDKNTGPISDLQSLQLTHKDRFVTFQFSVLDLIHPEKNQFRYMLENFDPSWIDNGERNTATYTNLPAGDYLFRVQGANSSGIWNREGLSLNVRVLPSPWKTWWAYCFYALATLLIGWNFHRIYHSFAIERRSSEQARTMFEAENRADDDMQEQLELQDELVQSAYKHNLETLSLVGECIAQQAGVPPDNSIDNYCLGNIRRIEALSCLEDCLYYQVGGPVANLQKYTDSIISKLLMSAPIDPESIITINEVPSRLLPAELASPLAIVLFELLENCIQHAFEKGSPANYIQITLEAKASDKRPGRDFELCVRDSGVGLTGSIEDLANNHSGIAIVQSIVDKLGGTVELVTNVGTAITVNIPEPGA